MFFDTTALLRAVEPIDEIRNDLNDSPETCQHVRRRGQIIQEPFAGYNLSNNGCTVSIQPSDQR